MTPIVEFYQENRTKVDSKLMEPRQEETINQIRPDFKYHVVADGNPSGKAAPFYENC